jgi:acyl-coenzyme A synthetase/AMP-(fatty) acid ligase
MIEPSRLQLPLEERQHIGRLRCPLAGRLADAVTGPAFLQQQDRAIVLVARALPPHGGEVEAELRNHFRRELPNFMQPGVIAWRSEMPRNANGKLDRERLKSELMA